MMTTARFFSFGARLSLMFFLLPHFFSGDGWFQHGLTGDALKEFGVSQAEEEKKMVIVVPGNVAWTDTGLDVHAGQEISFQATGRITLQVGNPDADCGPAGYNIQTVQQPIQGENLGALLGKVVLSVAVIIDEETKEERKQEVAQIFFIGAERKVTMPAAGRLFLGINENVIGDNGGQFVVTIATKDGGR